MQCPSRATPLCRHRGLVVPQGGIDPVVMEAICRLPREVNPYVSERFGCSLRLAVGMSEHRETSAHQFETLGLVQLGCGMIVGLRVEHHGATSA